MSLLPSLPFILDAWSDGGANCRLAVRDTGAAPVIVGALIAAALLGSAGVLFCRDDEDEASESQNEAQFLAFE